MSNAMTPSEKPVFDPRWNEYLVPKEFEARQPAQAPVEESAHNRQLRELMTEIISPWQFGEVGSRETLIRLKRLADLQL